MNLRETIRSKPWIGIAIGCTFSIVAVGVLAGSFWPHRGPDLSQANYSDDDGATWFQESAFKVPPFDHQGRQAVGAHVFSYENGSKQFCAYLTRYTAEGKKKLEQALEAAQQQGKPANSVELFQDRKFITTCMQAKLPGANQPWISFSNSKVNAIFTVKSPDGSAVDEVLAK